MTSIDKPELPYRIRVCRSAGVAAFGDDWLGILFDQATKLYRLEPLLRFGEEMRTTIGDDCDFEAVVVWKFEEMQAEPGAEHSQDSRKVQLTMWLDSES